MCGVLLCVCCVWCWCLVLVCNVWCVVSVVSGLWSVVCGVWRGLARGKKVCWFKKSPCVGSKRLRVYRQNARMCYHMRAFCQHTGRGFSSLFLFLFLFRRSLPSFSSFVLFSFSFSALFSLCSLQPALCVSFVNDNDNDRSSSWLSLYTWL